MGEQPTFSLTDRQGDLIDTAAGPAKHVLAYGGSRSGKTFGFIYAICSRALMAPKSRHAVFRRHGVAVKQSIGKDTLPKVMELAYPDVPIRWHEQDGYFTLETQGGQSEIWLAGLDDKERVDKVLGKEFATIYFNEASEIPLASYNVAQTRLAQNIKKSDGRQLALKSYVDLNPTTRAHWTYRLWIEGVNPDGEKPVNVENYRHIVMNPLDNAENLTGDYIEELRALPERQRARFFLGEFSADIEHALWRRDWFKRVNKEPDYTRIVVAIDPAVSNEVGSDETGIICAAIDAGGQGYVLEDESGKYRPEEWARRAISLYDEYGADRIVGEVNQGGDMVEHTLRTQRPDVPFTAVRASRGKVTRAEPVAALYERGKVFHAGQFDELESQMCAFTSDFDRKLQGYSPDRVDALVWAFTELFPRMTRKVTASGPILRPIGTMA